MSAKYWEYFLSLEDDLDKCTKYIEFTTENYSTYSIELAKLIVSASSEFENVLKDLCKEINQSSSPNNIVDIYPIIFSEFPRFTEVKVQLPRYKIQLQPLAEWTCSKRPNWWAKGYNKIKHSRDNSFNQANLQNALNSMGALFASILYYHQKISGGINIDYSRRPTLFDDIDDPGGATISLSYSIPL